MTQNFKVATFNLFNYAEPPSAFYEQDSIYRLDQWQKKEAWIANQLEAMDADIVGFQEVFSPDALAQLTQDLGYQYFSIIEKPQAKGFVFHSPVVALASKFPILEASAVSLQSAVKHLPNIASDFEFSRQPLKAVIDIKDFGKCAVYVVHLKSQRPFELKIAHNDNSNNTAVLTATLQSRGRWLSAIQRGNEASVLNFDMAETSFQKKLPVIFMGDLNDVLSSSPLCQFISPAEIQHIPPQLIKSLDERDKHFIQSFQLYDAFELMESPIQSSVRPVTHFHGNEQGILDYILLSPEFHLDFDWNMGEVVKCQTLNRHLLKPTQDDIVASDHAPVAVEICSRF